MCTIRGTSKHPVSAAKSWAGPFDTKQGQTTSQLQFSKYSPEIHFTSVIASSSRLTGIIRLNLGRVSIAAAGREQLAPLRGYMLLPSGMTMMLPSGMIIVWPDMKVGSSAGATSTADP